MNHCKLSNMLFDKNQTTILNHIDVYFDNNLSIFLKVHVHLPVLIYMCNSVHQQIKVEANSDLQICCLFS